MRDLFRYIITAIGLLMAAYFLSMLFSYADDNEDELGLCLRGYETHCAQPTLAERLLERVREWNIQTALNQTLDTAERFK